jgi:pimeloyl-ACP methyl ester carboxylesterase
MPGASEHIEIINGTTQHYEVYGTGEPLVLLHGFGGSSLDWAALAELWSADFQVIVPDMRGHGRSTNPSSMFRHDEAAGDLLALVDRLGATTFKGLGVSAGGNVLLHMATRQPDRVKGAGEDAQPAPGRDGANRDPLRAGQSICR